MSARLESLLTHQQHDDSVANDAADYGPGDGGGWPPGYRVPVFPLTRCT
jgi:hypothetical protein